MNSGVYKILNIVNGDFYIGSSINLCSRKNQHFSKLKKGTHINKHLQNSYNKYGATKFTFIILKTCNLQDCITLEQEYIDRLLPIYNKRLVASSNIGLKMNRTDSHNKKISNSLIGIKRSEETRQKFRKNNLGKVMSEETKMLISIKLTELQSEKKGVKRTEEDKDKMRIGKYTKGQTEKERLNRCNSVIDNNTGIIYESAKLTAFTFGINYKNLMRKLSGERNNNTNFKYVNGNKRRKVLGNSFVQTIVRSGNAFLPYKITIL